MNQSIRSNILLKLYDNRNSKLHWIPEALYNKYQLSVFSFFTIIRNLSDHKLINVNIDINPMSYYSTPVFPDSTFSIRISGLGVKYVESKLQENKNGYSYPDKYDSIQIGNVGLTLSAYVDMKYSEYEDHYQRTLRKTMMDKRELYYVLTGNFIPKENIKKKSEVIELIDLLEDYTIIKENLNSVFDKYNENALDRNLLDDIRFTFEQLLKKVFDNNLPLEKQNKNIKELLLTNQINSEIIGMYIDLFTRFYQYQNNNVKHNETYSISEIEFVLEIAISLMKMILKTRPNTKQDVMR